MIHQGDSSSNVTLPKTMRGHCIVSLNSTHYFFTGGITRDFDKDSGHASSYIFSFSQGFLRQPDMMKPRAYHACDLISQKFVFVAGGFSSGEATNTSEYFDIETSKWQSGPDLPISTYGAKMITASERTLFIGGKWSRKIFQLEVYNGWTWIEVGQMNSVRRNFSIMKIKLEDCFKWQSTRRSHGMYVMTRHKGKSSPVLPTVL